MIPEAMPRALDENEPLARTSQPLTLAAGLRGLPRHAWRVAPEIFEAVEFAFLAAEDVHDDLHVIEHDPLARGKSVHGNGADPVIVF